MPWFLTPHGPHFVVEPGTIDEYERRDYVQMTAQQVTDYYAGVAFPDPPSFATEAEVPGIVATAVNAGAGPVSDALSAAFALRTETPTLEELERVAVLGTVSATATKRLGPASFDQRIGGLTVAVSGAVAASDTNFWTVSLLRLRAGTNPLTIVTRTTKVTGGEAFTADRGWNFDAMQWLETARHLRKGDVLALTFTKTGTPADLTDVTAAVRYEPNVRPLIRDTFTRADSAISLGATDTGQPWTQLTGTWGINGQRAYISASPGYAFATFDSGLNDFTVSARLAAAGNSYGLVFRSADENNQWSWESSGLWKYEGGGFTQVVPYAGGWVSGDTFTAAASGGVLSVYRNGVLIGSTTDSFNQTATGVGLWIAPDDGVTRWDDLELAV